jgi:hypothetical protein
MTGRISGYTVFFALFLALALAPQGCSRGEQKSEPGESPGPADEQHLAIVVVLPADAYSADEKSEKQASLEMLIEEKGIGRVVGAEIRRSIIEVVFQVTMGGDVRGRLRGILLEWDPSLSYAIEERRLPEGE